VCTEYVTKTAEITTTQEEWKTSTVTQAPSTVYVTTTQEEVCTEYVTKTAEVTTTQEEWQTSTVTQAPSTVYVTTTQEEVCTEYVTKTAEVTTTQEQWKTSTVTQAPSTIYETTTQEEVCTEYVTKTAEVTTTQEEWQTSTVTQAPSTVYVTTTQEEVSTEYITKTQEEWETITRTEAPSTVYVTKTQEEVQTITNTQEEVQTVTQEQVQTVWVTKTQEQVQTVTTTQEEQQEQTQTVYVTQVVTSCEVTSPVSQTWPSTTQTLSSKTQTSTSQTHEASSCPTTLTGEWQYPHLIVPVNSSAPEKAYGTSYFGEITPDVSSIFNFDIPSSYSGMDCSLIFLFPEQSQLQTSSYTFSGSGDIDVAQLEQVATESTTYDTVPAVKKNYGEFTVAPGHSYSIATFACPASQAIAFEIKSEDDTSLNYFQDYNPSPIGLYITACTQPVQEQWQNDQADHGSWEQNHQSWGTQNERGQAHGWSRSRFFRL